LIGHQSKFVAGLMPTISLSYTMRVSIGLDLKGQVKNTFFAVKLGGAFMMRIYNI
jgi:hypothetical protein